MSVHSVPHPWQPLRGSVQGRGPERPPASSAVTPFTLPAGLWFFFFVICTVAAVLVGIYVEEVALLVCAEFVLIVGALLFLVLLWLASKKEGGIEGDEGGIEGN